MDADASLAKFWDILKAQQAESLYLRQELDALRECLAEAGVLRPVVLDVKMHRKRFAAALAAHPLPAWPQDVGWDEVLQASGVMLTIGVLVGGGALRAMGPTSRNVHAATSQIWPRVRALCGCHIYVCGGSGDGVEVLDTAERFSTLCGTWEALPPMIEPRCDATAQFIAGHVYVCGGCNGQSSVSSVLSSVERFDPFLSIWEAAPEMLFARRGAAAGAIAAKMYVCGGYNTTDGALDFAECLALTSMAWEALPLMLETRAEPAAGVIAGRLYVCGGRGGEVWAQLSSAERYDPGLGIWQKIPPMLEPRSGAAAASMAGRLYVCGGMGNKLHTSVERFDPEAGIWEAMPSMCVGRYCAAAAGADSRLYIFGGSHGWQHLRCGESFEPDSGTWMLLRPMSERRMAPAVAVSLH